MTQDLKISIIIPTYNFSKTILKAINSCLNQTYKNIEIIVVDDCSTDDTKKKINYLIKSNKISYFCLKENRNVSFARNYGIKKSKGDYICFLDSDDTFPKNSVKKRVDFLNKNPSYKIVCGDTNYISQNNKIMFTRKVNINKINKKKVYNEFLNYKSTPFITASIMYKQEVFNKIGFFDVSKKIVRSEDADFTYRVLKKYKIGYVNYPVYNYFKGSKKRSLRIKHLILQLNGKIYSISKHKKGPEKYFLIITNLLHFPLKFLHQILFF